MPASPTVDRSYQSGVDAGLSWAYAALIAGFAVSWLVLAEAARDEMGIELRSAIAALVVLALVTGRRGARGRLGDADVRAAAVVAVALQWAWLMAPQVAVSPGQRCMVTTAVVFGAFAFGATDLRVATIVLAGGAQLAVDWVAVGPVAAVGGLWPVVAAGIAVAAVVPALRAAADRADALASAQQRSFAEAADRGAQDRVRRDLHAVLHDAVVPALRALSLPELSLDEARRAASKAVLAIECFPVATTDDAPCDLAHLVRQLAPVPGAATTLSAGEAVPVPGEVARAAGAAAAEILRNVDRHAHAALVRVALERSSDGFVLTITDDGVGFRPAATSRRSHGLRCSVVRRMHDVGGRADIVSAPGHGTSVRLAWQSAVAPVRQAPSRADRLAAALDDIRRPLALVCLPYLAMTAAFASWYAIAGDLPWWVFAWFGGLAVLTVTALWRAHTGLSGAFAAVSLTYGVLGAVASLRVLPVDSLHTYASWPLGAVTALLAVVVLVRPPWEAGLAMVVQQVAIAVAALLGRFGPGTWTDRLAEATPAALSTVTPVMLGVVIGLAVLRLGDAVTRANDDRGARTASASALRARAASHRRRLAEMNEEILPFLRDVSDLAARPAPDGLRHRARVLERAARDELNLPGVLDAAARELLRRARGGGCAVTFQTGGLEITAPTLVRELLVTALASGATPRELVLSVGGTGTGTGTADGADAPFHLVTVPGDPDRAAALEREFGERLVVLDSSPEVTWVEVRERKMVATSRS